MVVIERVKVDDEVMTQPSDLALQKVRHAVVVAVLGLRFLGRRLRLAEHVRIINM